MNHFLYIKAYYCVKSAQIRSFFWSVFSGVRTEYGKILRIREIRTIKNSVFANFSRSVCVFDLSVTKDLEQRRKTKKICVSLRFYKQFRYSLSVDTENTSSFAGQCKFSWKFLILFVLFLCWFSTWRLLIIMPWCTLNHFWSLLPFYTPWKYQKTKGFLVFSRGIKERILFLKMKLFRSPFKVNIFGSGVRTNFLYTEF